GRMLRTRTSSSRISWESSRSSSSENCCKSAGEPILDSNSLIILCPWSAAGDRAVADGLTVSLQDVLGQRGKPLSRLAQWHKKPARLRRQVLGPTPAVVHSQETGIGQFTTRRVFLHALPALVGIALNVEQVIRNLKGLAETTS